MKHFLTIACAAVLLTACNKDSNKPEQPEEPSAKRTVLIYMAAENSLNSFVEDEIDEMKAGSKNIGADNLILYVDGADASTPPYLIRLKNGVGTDSVSMDETLASDPTTIYKVITKTFDTYPAEDYGLVLWGHASGWSINKDSLEYTSVINARSHAPRRAYGIDNGENSSSNTGKWINMPTLAKVLQRTGKKLKFIFADCCQFQCVESAYELRNTCDYIIASAAEIPGEGAPYETMVPAMFSQEENFYQLMCEAYFAQVSQGYREPLSTIKTSEMETLASATKTVLRTFIPNILTDASPYPNMGGLIYYQGSSYGAYRYMYDMNDFILQYAEENEYNVWKQAFDRAVVYKTPTAGLNNCWMSNSNNNIHFSSFTMTDKRYGGVSMFVPQYPSGYYATYNRDIRKMGWYYAAGLEALGW